MKKRTLKSKILSGILALSMLAGLLPLAAFAEDTAVQSKTLTSFAAVEGITVAVGESEPTLPPSVLATVSTTTAEDGSEAVPVTWVLPQDVAFSSAAAGEVFTYTAVLPSDSIYSLDAGVSLPTLTVTVAESEPSQDPTPAEISAFETVDAIDVPEGTAADALALPGESSATVNGAESTAVAVSWVAEGTAYSQDAEEGETFTYKAALQNEADYTLVNDASLPTLTVRVTAAQSDTEPETITAFADLEPIELEIDEEITEEEMIATFPKNLTATVEGETEPLSVPVTGWTLDFSSHNSGAFATDENAEIFYVPTLNIPEGYELSDEITQPALKVQVGEALLHAPQLMSIDTGAFAVTGDASSYSYAPHATLPGISVLTITGSAPLTISMAPGVSSTTTDTIVVQNNVTANLTLNSVNINVFNTNGACAFEIAGSATANITLQGANNLTSGFGKAGLQVETSGGQTATLHILAASTGSLYARSNGSTGIGGGDDGDGGNITISGGTVTATGQDGAGIGGGSGDSSGGEGGNITISGGTVTATSSGSGAGIGGGRGGGSGGEGGNITISGGTVTATGQDGAGIGGGGGTNDTGGAGGNITISGGTVTATSSGSGAGIGGGGGGSGGEGGAGGSITISGGTVTATGGHKGGAGIGAGIGSSPGDAGTFQTQASSATPGSALIIASSISDTTGKTNSVSNPWSGLFFENNSTSGQVYGNPVLSTDITIPAGKTLNVPTDKTLTIPSGRALVVAGGATLTITDNGGVANEGSVYNYGTIYTINNISGGGTIYPQSGNENPTVYLSGTSVYLRMDSGETQISYTGADNSWQAYTGTVTLTGITNTYTVTVLSGTHYVALKNANIDATGKPAFDIRDTSVVNLTLFGSSTLQSSADYAGLQVPNGATLNITENSSGSLHATGGSNATLLSGAAGIGGGHDVDGGTVTISGGTVVAEGNFGGAGIGGGYGGAGGTVKITGGSVTATANNGGTGIGAGQGSSTGDPIEIMGGTVTAMGSGNARALSAPPTYTLPNPSAGQFYSVSITAGATKSSATARTLSENYISGSNYVKIAMSSATPTIGITPNPALTYNGTQQTQNVTVKLGSATLTPGTYTLSGNTATNAGDYTLTVTVPSLGANSVYDTTAGTNYIGGGGTQTATYTIQRATLTITGATAQSRAYNGITDATADVSFSGLLNGETLTKGTDYTVSADFPSPDVGDNLTVGGVVQLTNTAKASNYIFNSAEFSFPTAAGITPLSLAGAQVALGTPIVANGTEQTQSVASVMLGGRILTEGTDYTVSGNTATNAGGYTLTITGTGNYMGTLAAPFTVVGTAGEALPYEPTGTLDKGNSTVPSGNTLHITPQSEVKQQQDLAKLREYAQQHGITGVVNFLEDITMTDANGNEVQPQNGNTRVRISVPGLTTADTVTVLHIKDDGSVEKISPITVGNGYVEFYPTSFSVYSVIVHKAGTGVTSALSPQTGVY